MKDANMNESQWGTAFEGCMANCTVCTTYLKWLEFMNTTSWDSCRPFLNSTGVLDPSVPLITYQSIYEAGCAATSKKTTFMM